jgi:2-(1,2-epoxy-1,2-dihydrophenyl)acetyl-CoA isomerase
LTAANGTETVLLTLKERVATLELNRPESLNAMNEQMLKELLAALKEVKESDADILIISGKGRGFSAGGDIKSMLNNVDDSSFLPIMETIKELIVTLYSLPKLTISVIHGPAAGLGLSFALASDYIVADRHAKLAMNFIGIGLIPDGGGHFFLEKRLGVTKAKKVIWEGKTMLAEEALQIGLIDEITDGDVFETVNKITDEWLKKPVQAMIQTKKIYTEFNRSELLQILDLETYGQRKMRETYDHAEGIKAFLEKRNPNFIGK